MSNTTNYRNEALTKLENLAVALADCGIAAEVSIEDDNGIYLRANLWNCYDGSTELFEVWAEEDTDYAFESCINPVEKINEALEKFCENA